MWVALLCVYAGVWRYLTSMYRGSPLSLTTNIVKHSPVAATENSLKFAKMKRVFVTLSLIFCMNIVAFSQNVVKLGDELLTVNSMEKSPKILTNGGMVIEPIEEMLGIDPDLRITASNGVEPQVPIMCTVEAMSKVDRRISIITFIYNGNARKLETNLRNLGYKFLDNGQYREYIHTFRYSRYQKGNKYCRISYPANGEKGAKLEFVLQQ